MDNVHATFLAAQLADAAELTRDSDLVELTPLGAPFPERYLIELRCRGLVRDAAGEIVLAERFSAGVWFPGDYLDRANALEVVTWLGPPNAHHPNIGPGPGGHVLICIGKLRPATPLLEIVERVYDVVTYNKVTMYEGEALNHAACVWARRNQERFPIDARPLRRRVAAFAVRDEPMGGAA